jgi:hypothetical protein
LRILKGGGRALVDPGRPVLAHLVAVRRCNLACGYCNEYDAVSEPVPSPEILRRIDRLWELGTLVMTLSGGEPLLHPDLDCFVAHGRRRGLFVTLISNGYYLSPERIERFNRAGLDHLQISVDNVEPDDVSRKSLRLLEPKLVWLSERADFTVALNSVLGSGVKRPEDALVVARRARTLGFSTSVGIVHDGRGQLRALGDREMRVYEELRRLGRTGLQRFNSFFQDNLARGLPNDWSCRAGARYLYVDENGIVSYCSQQRGIPGIPLEEYSSRAIRREFDARKPCAPYCTVTCVHQVALLDRWRFPQRAFAPGPLQAPSRVPDGGSAP